MDQHTIPDYVVTSSDHPSLAGAVEMFALDLRAESLSFGRGTSMRKPSPSLVRRLRVHSPGVHLAAVAAGRVVAMARIDAMAPTGPELLIAVVAEWRGRGLATELGSQVVARAAAQGYQRILLHTSTRSPRVSALGAALGFDLVEIDCARLDLVWRGAPVVRTA